MGVIALVVGRQSQSGRQWRSADNNAGTAVRRRDFVAVIFAAFMLL